MRRAHLIWLVLIGGACGGRSERDLGATSEDRSRAGAPAVDGSSESACAEQRRLYSEYRAEITAQLSTNPCVTADDCMIFEDHTGCSPTCGYVIPKDSKRGIADRLYAYAEKNCDANCPPLPIPPCAPPAPPECVMNLCQ